MADTQPKATRYPQPDFGKAEVHPPPPKMHSQNPKLPDASGITHPPAPNCGKGY